MLRKDLIQDGGFVQLVAGRQLDLAGAGSLLQDRARLLLLLLRHLTCDAVLLPLQPGQPIPIVSAVKRAPQTEQLSQCQQKPDPA